MGTMERVVITGGTGFIGLALSHYLRQRGTEVTVLARHHSPAAAELGCRCVVGDIRDGGCLQRSFAGHDTVFHIAALAGIWGRWEDYAGVNVQGTRNVLAACRHNGISRLVYTSTPSVVFAGRHIEGGDETMAYARHPLCAYAATKIMAEKEVLAANGDVLRTIAIRPHLVYGPGDNHLVPRLLERARAGRLRMVGRGRNRVDMTYIENAVQAHVLAAEHLAAGGQGCGHPFFIGDGVPVLLWDWVNTLLARNGLKTVSRRVPYPVAVGMGGMLEWVYMVLRLRGEPAMTRFLAGQLGLSHWFSHARAKELLGYRPRVTGEEGFEHLVSWCSVSG